MSPLDLFGGDTPVVNKPKRETILSRWKRVAHYRKADKDKLDRCKYCCNFVVRRLGNTYFKCVLVGCGGSPSTDIRANHICDFFNKHIDVRAEDSGQKD